mgnify:CR=1 FL=1
MKKILFVIILSTLFCSDLSIIDKKNLAKTYYEAELYEDAIIILKEVLEIEKKIFSDRDIQLLDTITKLYELNYFLGNFEIAKIYLQEYINIQSSYLLEQQALFTKPLSALKEIYINEKEPELIYQVRQGKYKPGDKGNKPLDEEHALDGQYLEIDGAGCGASRIK